MFIQHIATAFMIAASVLAVDDAPTLIFDISNNTVPTANTSPKVILTDNKGHPGPTAIPGSSAGLAIIGDKTYTAGAPAQTTNGNTINAILTNGVVYNNHTYTYTTTNSLDPTYLPSQGIVVIDGHTLSPGGPPLSTQGQIVSAGTDGIVIEDSHRTTLSSTRSQTVTFESETMTASEISSGVWAVYTATLTVSGDAKTVLGEQVTAAPTGLVVESPDASSTESTTGGAARLTTGAWAGLVGCGLLFSLL